MPGKIVQKLEAEVGGPCYSADWNRLMPYMENGTYRSTNNEVIDILDYENDSESEEEFRFKHGLIPRVRKRTKRAREIEFIERQKRKAGVSAPPPPSGANSPTASPETTPTNSRDQSPCSADENLQQQASDEIVTEMPPPPPPGPQVIKIE